MPTFTTAIDLSLFSVSGTTFIATPPRVPTNSSPDPWGFPGWVAVQGTIPAGQPNFFINFGTHLTVSGNVITGGTLDSILFAPAVWSPQDDILDMWDLPSESLISGVQVSATLLEAARLTTSTTDDLAFLHAILAGDDNFQCSDASANPFVIFAAAGNDLINMSDTLAGGNDSLQGGTGNDTIFGAHGADKIEGNEDNDSLSGGDGTDWVIGGIGTDTIMGGNDADSLFGGTGVDSLLGDAGFDAIYGGSSNDRLFGGAGTDTLKSDAGLDRLFGGTESDRLSGGLGVDTLTGGTGNDAFVFLTLAECGDTNLDFTNVVGNNDRYLLSATGFGGGLSAGGLMAAQFQTRIDNVAQDANDRFIYRTTDNTLWFDANGNAAGGLTLVADAQAGAVVTAVDIVMF